MPMRSLHGEPVFEPGRAWDLEAVEEVAVDQRCRVGPVALLHELLELIRIELHRAIGQLDHVACCSEMILADVVSERANGLTHRLPRRGVVLDRKSTRLNSSHLVISYAVFCL